MKKILIISILLFGLAYSAFAFSGSGSGTLGDSWVITNCSQLQEMNESLGGNYSLGNNIDCDVAPYNTGSGFNPVGNNTNKFTGSFNGQDHTITGLYINRDSDYYVGLFGYIYNVTIQDLNMESIDINGDRYVGSIAGEGEYAAFLNCNATGNVTGESYYVGGIVGYYLEGGSDDIHFTGNVTSVLGTVGGLIGRYDSNSVSNYYISESSSSGNVKCTSTSAGNNAGGLVGSSSNGNITESYSNADVTCYNRAGGLIGDNQGAIVNSYALGDAEAFNYYAGGLVGWNGNHRILNSYSIGHVNSPHNEGGLIGYTSLFLTFNSYWDMNTSTLSTSATGTGKTTAEMNNQSTFSNWDFDNIWGIDPGINDGYPYLLWINGEGTPPQYDNFPVTDGTTNFSAEDDLTDVINLTLATEDSNIQFPEEYSVDADGEDYDSNIILGDCYIAVNSNGLDPTFNATANLTLENADGHCGDNKIYYSSDYLTSAESIRSQDNPCIICSQIQKSSGFITKFQVSHFSSYAIGSNSRLDIYDSYEGSTAPVGADIDFYANYTNRTSTNHISAADCKIWFSDNATQILMTDNGNNYNYTRNFSSAASYTFYVNCSKPASGYNTLNASDDVNVGNNVPEFSMITMIIGLAVLLAGIIILRKR